MFQLGEAQIPLLLVLGEAFVELVKDELCDRVHGTATQMKMGTVVVICDGGVIQNGNNHKSI